MIALISTIERIAGGNNRANKALGARPCKSGRSGRINLINGRARFLWRDVPAGESSLSHRYGVRLYGRCLRRSDARERVA